MTNNLYFIANELGKYECSEIKNATERALRSLRHTAKLASPYQKELQIIVSSLEQILEHAKKNTEKDTRVHNYEPNYSIWSLD
jgi:hypothetical protein